MQVIGFYLALPFIYLISILPFPLLYLVSDIVFMLMYHVIGYRKKVVTHNLKNSFPEKTEKDILELRRKFYRYLCDLMLETFKTLSISKATMKQRCTVDNESIVLLNKYADQKKSIVLVLGHLGNWEWGGNAFSLYCKHPLFVIYHPLENKFFNHLIIGMRTRFGTKLIEMKNSFRDMVKMKNGITATAFIADQTPQPDNAHWINFLNQDTPVFKGTEVIARKLNYPVLFISIKKTGRGYYELFAELLCEDPASTIEGELTAMHTKKLESEILKSPENWLWSHRRWKHKRA